MEGNKITRGGGCNIWFIRNWAWRGFSCKERETAIRSKCATEGSLAGILWLWWFLLGQSRSGKEKFILNVTSSQSMCFLLRPFLFPCAKINHQFISDPVGGEDRERPTTEHGGSMMETKVYILTIKVLQAYCGFCRAALGWGKIDPNWAQGKRT